MTKLVITATLRTQGRSVAFNIRVRGENMGIHPKIGITGLPRSGKSAVLEKVVSMIAEERKQEKLSLIHI